MDSWDKTEQEFYKLSGKYKAMGGTPPMVGPVLMPEQAEELLPELRRAVARGKVSDKLEARAKQLGNPLDTGALTF
jgi:hypothetical protein